MTFSMSELQQTSIVINEEEENELDALQSAKELEEEKKRAKEQQAKMDDIALVICMIVIMLVTCAVVFVKVTVIDEKPNPNISTFRPLDQKINSNIKYNGNGYMGCNGYVPCQPEHLRPDLLAERIEGAMPCHNYNDEGEQPAGCW